MDQLVRLHRPITTILYELLNLAVDYRHRKVPYILSSFWQVIVDPLGKHRETDVALYRIAFIRKIVAMNCN